MKLSEKKNLVFDVGGVLIGFRWQDMLADHGFTPAEVDAFGHAIFDEPLWKEFDLQNIPFEGVVETYARRHPGLAEDIRWFFSHAEQMSVPRPRVWDAMGRLKEAGYRLYLLSNYGSVLFEKHTAGAAFHQYLDGAVISWQIHAIKPDPEIYQTLLTRYGLNPADCVFFDDLEPNVEGARTQGIDAVLVESEEQLLAVLEGILEDCKK